MVSNRILFGYWLSSHHPSLARCFGVCFRLPSPAASVESASFSISARCSQACPRTGKRQQWDEQSSALPPLCAFPWGGQGIERGQAASRPRHRLFFSADFVRGLPSPAGPAPRCSQGSCPYPLTKPGTAKAGVFNSVVLSLLQTCSVLSQEYLTRLYWEKIPFHSENYEVTAVRKYIKPFQEQPLPLCFQWIHCWQGGRICFKCGAEKNNSFLKERWHFWKARALTPFRASSGKPEAASVSVPSWLKNTLVGELLPLIWV